MLIKFKSRYVPTQNVVVYTTYNISITILYSSSCYYYYYYFLAEMVPAHLLVLGSNLLPIKIGIITVLPTSKQKTIILLVVLVSSMPPKKQIIQLVTVLLQLSVIPKVIPRTAIVIIMFTMSKLLLNWVHYPKEILLVKEPVYPYQPRHLGQRWKNLQNLLYKVAFEACLWTESSKFDTNL